MLKPKEIEEITAALWYIPLEKLQEVRALVESLKERFGSMRYGAETNPYEEDSDGPAR